MLTIQLGYKQFIKKQIQNTKNINYKNKDYVYKDKKNRIVNPQSGSLIVMDVENGEILCSVSSPGYDPNIFSDDLETNVWNNLKNNLVNLNITFTVKPHTRFKGEKGEQSTFFIKDPSGNYLEFKSFKNDSAIFEN